jgi:hypothetical protein
MEDKLEVLWLWRFVAERERPSASVVKPAINFLILFVRPRGSSGSLSPVRPRMNEMRRQHFFISYLFRIVVNADFYSVGDAAARASCNSFAVLDINI